MSCLSKRFLKTAVIIGLGLNAPNAIAQDKSMRFLPEVRIDTELNYNVTKHERIRATPYVGLELTLFSKNNFGTRFGAKFSSPIRHTENPWAIQPDQINYDTWLSSHYKIKKNDLSAFMQHRCYHNVDALNKEVLNYNMLGLGYERRIQNFLAGTKINVSIAKLINKHANDYLWNFKLDPRIGLYKINKTNITLYANPKLDMFTANKESDGWLIVNASVEGGLSFKGEKASIDTFIRSERIEDYMKFDGGVENLLLLGFRFK